MKEEANYFQETKLKINQYIDKRILLMRLQVADKASRIASTVLTAIILIIIGLFVLIFASFTAGYWLTDLTESPVIGFGIVALFYLFVFLLVIFFLRKVVRNFLVDKFIKLINEKD